MNSNRYCQKDIMSSNFWVFRNCNHLFIQTIIDNETGSKSEKYIGDEVFGRIENWLSSK